MKRQWKGFICGALVMLLAIGLVGPAAATVGKKAVNLAYNNIKVTVNGGQVNLINANGNSVEPFIIDGTTYLPVRAVASALGLDVGWDGATSTVKLTTKDYSKAQAVEEQKSYYTGITFDNLARNPDAYNGQKVQFTGEVLEVIELPTEIQIRLATKANSWGGYSDNDIYLYFDSGLISSRILEKDIITIYGVAQGLYSYTTVMNAKRTLPLVKVEQIDI